MLNETTHLSNKIHFMLNIKEAEVFYISFIFNSSVFKVYRTVARRILPRRHIPDRQFPDGQKPDGNFPTRTVARPYVSPTRQ